MSKHNIRYALSNYDIDQMCDWLMGIDLLAFDLETTGLDPYALDAKVVSASFTDVATEETWVVPINHRTSPWAGATARRIARAIGEVLLHEKPGLIAHNAQFDLRWWLVETDIDLTDLLVADTEVQAHILDEEGRKALKVLASSLMGADGDWGIDVRDCYNAPLMPLLRYNALDTIATSRLYRAQRDSFEEQGGWAYSVHDEIVLPAARTLSRTVHRGIMLDRKETERRQSEAWEVRAASSHLLMAVAVHDLDLAPEFFDVSWEPTAKWFLAFTQRCVDKGMLEVLETTERGRPSWSKAVLQKQAESEVARLLLQYRRAAKDGQFFEKWLESSEGDGRIHANYNIARTRTGRLSSSDPNMQQVGRHLKDCFKATPGWKLCEIDFSQIELRIMAEFIHRDVLPNNPMIQAYLDDRDLHKENAALVHGRPADTTSKDERQKGKAVGFGFNFGMFAPKFVDYALNSYDVIFTLDEAEAVRSAFFDRWEGLGEWHLHQAAVAMEQGYVDNLFGRRRHLPAIWGDWGDRSQAERQAINSPIQSTANDLMLMGLVRIENRFDPRELRIVGTVHDSVLLEVRDTSPTDVYELVDAACSSLLDSPVPLTVPLAVEAQWGDHWGVYADDNIIEKGTLHV